MGFVQVGFSKAVFMDEEARRLEQWLHAGNHGEMNYMENHFDKRVDPTLLVPGAKSVISFLYNYHNPDQPAPGNPKISQYAYGRDYHKVVKKKLRQLWLAIQEKFGPHEGRIFVDSAPVMERDWARRSGLGWMGKHTLLINPKKGSYFFLGEIISDIEVDQDNPMKDYCGTCTRCIDACPTDAISENGYQLDARKCISYLTIELKGDIPSEFKGKMDNWIFGCDICQAVCPWNRFATRHQENDFTPKETLLDRTYDDYQDMTEEEFQDLFFGTPVKRTGYQGLKRNIDFVKD